MARGMTMLKVRTGLAYLLLLSAVIVAPAKADAEGLMNRRQLVDEFVRGLSSGRKYSDVAHLFVSLEDFDALIEALKAADLPASYRRQLEGNDNLEKQREMLRQIDKQLVERWTGLISDIKDRKATLALKTFTASTKTNPNRVQFVELELSFNVTEAGKQKQVTRVLRAMQLGGRLKIVALFKDL